MKKTLPAFVLSALLLAACGGSDQTSDGVDTAADKQPAATKKLNIFNWSDYVDPDTVSAFEAAEGVKIRYDFYDSNEALEAKLLTGNSGYDLVAPSISNIGRQIKAGAYREIDKSKIPNYSNIDPELLKQMEQVDPGNKYAVPYFWGINTLAINEDKVKAALGDKWPENEWDLVFNPEYTAKLKHCGISFFDSPTEQYPLALKYLGKNPNSEEAADIEAATDLMRKVRGDIKRFTSSGYIDDMASGNLCVAIGYGGDLNIAKTRAEEASNGRRGGEKRQFRHLRTGEQTGTRTDAAEICRRPVGLPRRRSPGQQLRRPAQIAGNRQTANQTVAGIESGAVAKATDQRGRLKNLFQTASTAYQPSIKRE